MNFTKHFSQISKADNASAGGKGASLGEMTQAGISVPPGFVVLSAGFEKFLEETDLNVEIDSILHSVNTKEMHTIENASEKIKDLILKDKIPKDISQEIKKEFKKLNAEFVAVRSSATAEDSSSAAWAGQLDTFLNTTEKTLLANVQKCWASLFTPRAIFYRFEKGLHNSKISVAVVVQKMVESEVSGIAFSVHPVTQDHNQMIIEAGYGLGEAIVSGQITPDSYVVEKEPRRIIDKNISVQEKGIYRKSNGGGNEWQNISQEKGQQQKLTDEQILELSEMVIKIEKHYGAPQDIEWAREDNRFYITQSRPITTLGNNISQSNDQKELVELVRLDFPLMLAEIADYGESLKNIPWSKESFEFDPYCVFVKKDNQIYLYYEKAGMEWKTRQAGKFDKEKMKNKALEGYYVIKDIILKEKSLTKNELKKFLQVIKEYWTWWDCMWWMIEYYDQNKLPLEDILAVRKETEYLAPGMAAVIRNSVSKLYPKKKKFADVLLSEDVLNGDIPANEILKKRLKGVAYTNGKIYSSFADVQKKFNVKIKEIVIQNSLKELKGRPAYPGIVTGKVKIIGGRKNLGEFGKGEILVASTTTPDFLPIMKKAFAIISEQGGVVCHASITSRELKIPCIVGVSGATQFLHDGDLVEVDADKGVVRIIKKVK